MPSLCVKLKINLSKAKWSDRQLNNTWILRHNARKVKPDLHIKLH